MDNSAQKTWRAALSEYRAAKGTGAFRPDARTCSDLLARVAGVVRKGHGPAGDDAAAELTERAAAAREIVDDVERSDVPTTEATYALLARACAAAGDAGAATAALARARAANVAVRRRAYAPVLALRCARGELDPALALAREAAAGGVALGAADHAALLACAGRGGRRDRVPALLAAFARDVPVAPAPEPAWGAVLACAPRAWRGARFARVDAASGACAACGATLEAVALGAAERGALAARVASLALQACGAARWAAFERWLATSAHDCVVDGANAGFAGGAPFLELRRVDAVVRACEQRGRRPLVVLHARHVHRAAPRDRPLVRAWRRRGQLYACPAGGNDDWYWLAAAVAAGAGGWLVSNDEMRDHHFGMLSRGDFLRWKARHVVKFALGGGGVALDPPPPYSAQAQFRPGAWHVPTRVGAGAGEAVAATVVTRREQPGALAWLCCAAPGRTP